MDAPDYVVVLITVPNQEIGEKIAHHLLDHNLAACVNFISQVRSLYLWQSSIQDDQEVLLLVKTRASLFDTQLVPAVKALHPYQVPEIIALPILMGSRSYLDWISDVTQTRLSKYE